MKAGFKVSLKKIVDEFSLLPLYPIENVGDIMVCTADVNRPGLQMAGYYEFFDNARIQVIGKSEHCFLERFTPEKAEKRMIDFFSRKPVAVVVARNLHIEENYIKIAKEYNVPLFTTGEATSSFSSSMSA